MNVKQLMETLTNMLNKQEISLDMEVETEGCDCIGDVGSVEVHPRGAFDDPKDGCEDCVYLRRR